MPVCVVGMHRSGTSMVTRQLNLCGLYLGDEDQLSPATRHNPDGQWEHLGFQRINEQLLNHFGGGWDLPPIFPEGWELDPRLNGIANEAARLVASFDRREPWGWKDPRSSLTIPFWKRVAPGVRFVVCVRNPLEVAASMRRRGLCSYAMALSLWDAYNRRIVENTSPSERLVCHFDAYFDDLHAVIARVGRFLRNPPDAAALERCAAAVRGDLRHTRFTTASLAEVNVSPAVLELYARLCADVEWKEPPPMPDRTTSAWLDLNAMDAEMLRREVSELRGTVEAREEQIQAMRHALDAAAAGNAKAAEAAEATRRELASQRQEIERLRASVEESARVVRETAKRLGGDFDALAARLQYQNTVRRIQEALAPLVPPGAVVAVASKGDDALLAPFGASASHFPRGDDGGYAGYYPADGGAAVRHLEDLRAGGVTHLVLPETALWWLDAYPEFRRHLDTHYPPPERHAGAGTLFFLSPVNNNGNGNSAGMSSR